MYVRSNQYFTQTLPSHAIPSGEIQGVTNKKIYTNRSKSKDKKYRRRKDLQHGKTVDEAFRDESNPNESCLSSHSAPTSPAQKSSKSRRHHRESSSHKANLKKVKERYIFRQNIYPFHFIIDNTKSHLTTIRPL